MAEPTERTHKLLVLAGQESVRLEGRDFNRLVDVIVKEYLGAPRPAYEQFLLEMLVACIRQVPLKQHIYAALVAEIYRVSPDLAIAVVKHVVGALEKDLNTLRLHQSINCLYFLSELMNYEKLNSQSFYDLIDDIVIYIESTKNASHKAFLSIVFSRTLPNFCYALNKKLYFELKKLLERAKKFCKNTEFNLLYQSFQKGTVADNSAIFSLFQESEQQSQGQIQQNLKLKLNLSEDIKFAPIEYLLPQPDEADKLYEEFLQNEGAMHLTNVEQIIQLMKKNSEYLVNKIINYLSEQDEDNSNFIQRYCVEVILGKALKAKHTIVQSFILVKLIANNKVFVGIVEKALQRGLDFEDERYDLSCQMKFAQVLSYVVRNWPTGHNQMTDIGLWDWQRFLSASEGLEGANLAKRNVLLKVICQKIELLQSGYKFPQSLQKFAPPEDLKSASKFKVVEQMEIQQNFQGLISKKAEAELVLESIKAESDYEIFLDCLFEKTSQSHTHLEKLLSRYEAIFLKYKQQYDWNLLNITRSYWAKSLFHRLLYIGLYIERGYVEFSSYVKYIAKVETSSQEEAHELKIELNELHLRFADKLDAPGLP